MDKIINFSDISKFYSENGNYIESPHCALLIENILKNKGVKSEILYLHDSKDAIEHYFTL